jgi:outer membrane lipoprotein LolB
MSSPSIARRFRLARTAFGGMLMCALLAASGCATVSQAPGVPAGAGKAPDPATFTTWTARGRIALAARGEGGSGSFTWQQRDGRTELAVRGPLGAGGLNVVSEGAMLEFNDATGRALDGAAARQALEAQLGAPIPLDDLRYWLIGLPAPGGEALVQAASGATPGFVQGAWVVSYDAHTEAGGWRLPARMTATTAGVKVRVIVDDWQVPAP